ncbi:MAG: lipopolysaccharide biosynthesis protein [Caldilineales bacterium]|nr:lipopolysaccharide biosynthesis protein [Caldilineales bacterium]
MSIRSQVTSGAIWVGLSAVVVKLLAFITITLVLARVLDPTDFGLVGIAWLAINALEFFREMGIASALIYRQKDDHGIAADVTFISLCFSSIFVYMAAFVLAPAIEYFFSDAEGITPVLRVLALTMIINSISQTSYTLLAKDMQFRSKAIPEIIGGVLNAIVAVVMALTGFGVWALVGGYLADAFTRTGLVWFFSPWRPRLRFDKRVWNEMMSYGRHIVGSRILIFGITNIDDLFIGRFLGAAAFGLYTFAYRLSNVPATHVTGMINNVMFPAFSKMQEEKERVRRGYFATIHAVGLVTIPLAAATLALGPTFVHNYYQGKWDGAIVAMEWLVIYGLMRSIAANLGNIYRSLGKPEWLTWLALWRFVTMLVLLYPAIIWGGIVGVSLLSAVVSIIDFAIAAWMGKRLMGGSYMEYVHHLGPASGASAFAGIAAFVILQTVSTAHWLAPFLLATISMIVLYCALSWAFDPVFRHYSLALLRRLGPTRGLATRLGA